MLYIKNIDCRLEFDKECGRKGKNAIQKNSEDE